MAVDKGIYDWHEGLSSLLLGQPVPFHDLVKKFAASAVFHDQEEVLLVLVDVIQFDNVGVIDLFQDFDLVLNVGPVVLSQLSLRYHLHCDPVAVHPTHTLAHGCKGTFTNDMAHFIVYPYVAKLRIFLNLLLLVIYLNDFHLYICVIKFKSCDKFFIFKLFIRCPLKYIMKCLVSEFVRMNIPIKKI